MERPSLHWIMHDDDGDGEEEDDELRAFHLICIPFWKIGLTSLSDRKASEGGECMKFTSRVPELYRIILSIYVSDHN